MTRFTGLSLLVALLSGGVSGCSGPASKGPGAEDSSATGGAGGARTDGAGLGGSAGAPDDEDATEEDEETPSDPGVTERWLAYVGTPEGGLPSLFLQNTVDRDATPLLVFAASFEDATIELAGTSPNRRYLWFTARENDVRQTYYVDRGGEELGAPIAVGQAGSLRLFWSDDESRYPYLVPGESGETVYLGTSPEDEAEVGTYADVSSLSFVGGTHLAVTDSDAALLEFNDLEDHEKSGLGLGHPSSVFRVLSVAEDAPEGPSVLVVSQHNPRFSHDWVKPGVSPAIDFLALTELPALASPDGLWLAQERMEQGAVVGFDLVNHATGTTVELYQEPSQGQFSAGSRWYAGIDSDPGLFVADLTAEGAPLAAHPMAPGEGWAHIHTICPQEDWLAAETSAGALHLLELQSGAVKLTGAVAVGPIDDVGAVTCSPDSRFVGVGGATDAGAGLVLVALEDVTAEPRDLLAQVTGAVPEGDPAFSGDGAVVALRTTGGASPGAALRYTSTTDADAGLATAACGAEEAAPCTDVSWFSFLP